MAFRFRWPQFSDEFYAVATELVQTALNRGQKPPHICDDIEVKQLHLGSQPPQLEAVEIGELSAEKFKGIFRLNYGGDAFLLLQTKVQVNPVTHGTTMSDQEGQHRQHQRHASMLMGTRHGIVSAHKPLVVPMLLRISQLRIRAILTLAVDAQKGVTLSFKNDPLESVRVNSTFDDVANVRDMLQLEIEKSVRVLLADELSGIVHRLSLSYMHLTEPSIEETLGYRERASDNNDVNNNNNNQPSQADISRSLDSGLGVSTATSLDHVAGKKSEDNDSYRDGRVAGIDDEQQPSTDSSTPQPRPLPPKLFIETASGIRNGVFCTSAPTSPILPRCSAAATTSTPALWPNYGGRSSSSARTAPITSSLPALALASADTNGGDTAAPSHRAHVLFRLDEMTSPTSSPASVNNQRSTHSVPTYQQTSPFAGLAELSRRPSRIRRDSHSAQSDIVVRDRLMALRARLEEQEQQSLTAGIGGDHHHHHHHHSHSHGNHQGEAGHHSQHRTHPTSPSGILAVWSTGSGTSSTSATTPVASRRESRSILHRWSSPEKTSTGTNVIIE